jgi:hypothetical protein
MPDVLMRDVLMPDVLMTDVLMTNGGLEAAALHYPVEDK